MSLREKAIDRLIKIKELGITEAEIEAMEIQMSKSKPNPITDVKEQDLLPPVSPFDNISDEELLYYATPYYDELQAKKDLQANASKGE